MSEVHFSAVKLKSTTHDHKHLKKKNCVMLYVTSMMLVMANTMYIMHPLIRNSFG